MEEEGEHILRRPEMVGEDRFEDDQESDRPCKCTREDCCAVIGSVLTSISIAGLILTLVFSTNLSTYLSAGLLTGLTITGTVGCYLCIFIGCVGRGRRYIEPTGVARTEIAPGEIPPRVRRRRRTHVQNAPGTSQAHIDPEGQGSSRSQQSGEGASDSPLTDYQNDPQAPAPISTASNLILRAAVSIAQIAEESVSGAGNVTEIKESGYMESSDERKSLRQTSPSKLGTAPSDRKDGES